MVYMHAVIQMQDKMLYIQFEQISELWCTGVCTTLDDNTVVLSTLNYFVIPCIINHAGENTQVHSKLTTCTISCLHQCI